MSEKRITIRNLQEFIKKQDYHPENKTGHILKFMEESGELAEAMLHEFPHADGKNIKSTIEEEFCDVLHCLLALANVYDVNIEKWFPVKAREADRKYNRVGFFDNEFKFVTEAVKND